MDGILREIRSELGSDVHLLETRAVRQPGILGFLRPKQVEISVAYEVPRGARPAEEPSGRTRDARAFRDQSTVSRAVSAPRSPGESRTATEPKVRAGTHGENHPIPGPQDAGDDVSVLLEMGVPEYATGPLLRGHDRGGSFSERLPWFRSIPIGEGPHRGEEPRVVAMVGPTGAGKTTTCAKLAAQLALGRGAVVGIITVDTFRVGAVEQIRTYARILRAPLEVIVDPEDAPAAVRRLSHCDFILVDTTGRAHHDDEALANLGSLLASIGAREVHLVLGLNTDLADARAAIRAYKCLEFNRLLLTKADETSRPGKAISLVEAAGVPLSYVSTGQGVPDDIEEPAAFLSDLLVDGVAK